MDRSAVDTIKGYFYQFDFSIMTLLKLKRKSDTAVIEGIEDIDVATIDEESAIQCKYFSKTEYNHSVIAKPIRLMLNHYAAVTKGKSKRVNYKLHCCFSEGQEKLTIPLTQDFLIKHILTYTENKKKREHHIELNLDDSHLSDFISLLDINVSANEYVLQLSEILSLLMHEFQCTAFEAEHFYYNNALKAIKNIAVKDKVEERKVSKEDFLNTINFKGVLFNEWFIKFKGEKKHFSELRNQYFATLNISPFERFFLIEVPPTNYLRSDIKDLIFCLAKKWSKSSAREPFSFCPYVYLHNLSDSELLAIKNELHSEDHDFLDGHKYEGSSFDAQYLAKPLSKGREIKVKFLNRFDYIKPTLEVAKKRKEVYQFYYHSPFFDEKDPGIKHVKIQISRLTDLTKII